MSKGILNREGEGGLVMWSAGWLFEFQRYPYMGGGGALYRESISLEFDSTYNPPLSNLFEVRQNSFLEGISIEATKFE